MNTADLKMDLINRINQIKENHVLEEINRLLDFESEEGVFKLSAEQRERILKGQEEYKNGKVLSEAEANKQIQSWLDK